MESHNFKVKVRSVLRTTSDVVLDSSIKTEVKKILLDILHKTKNEIEIVFEEERLKGDKN